MAERNASNSSTARRRFGASLNDSRNGEAWRRALCAAVFDDPGRIVDALSHPVTGHFVIESHHHTDLLQLDVIQQCEGEAEIDGRPWPIERLAVMATPPGVMHGYTLRPVGADATVWLVKIRVGRDGESALPPLLTGRVGGWESLRAAAAGIVGDWTPQGVSLPALVSLTNTIVQWPHSLNTHDESEDDSGGSSEILLSGDGPSSRVRRAIETVGRRLDDPPGLAELAAVANLSPRHFSRRFRQDFDCTPHDYLQARRLDAARGLLRNADRRVSNVADELGFSSPAAFSRWFTRLVGQTPRAFRDDPQNY
ncbi:MAG: AraC family transcriptional regulator [Planctomycetota bacterium]